jgi:hypothetical protein
MIGVKRLVVEGKEYDFTTEQDIEPDVIKNWHFCFDVQTGETHHIDCSPYGQPDDEFLTLWILCGMPDRGVLDKCSPIYKEDLIAYADQLGLIDNKYSTGE